MKLLEHVLVPIDFGPRTDSVIAAATCLAETFGCQVHLLHVLPEIDDALPEALEVMRMARQGAAGRLAEVRSRLEEAGASTAEEIVAEGSPFDQIILHAEEIEANVIMVGSRNDDGAAGLRIGMTAERLCRMASTPVWVVAAESTTGPTRILCPVDCSSPSKRALQSAIHLARRFDARLFVLHVIRPVSTSSGLIPSVQRGMQQKHVASETTRFEGFLGEFDFHGIRWEKAVREGIPADTIIATVSEFSADLVIMGSVGRTGLSQVFLGSVAGKVARQLQCSLVMLKAEDAIRLKLDQDLSVLNTHHGFGCELLENGFLNEAKRQFERCIQISDLFAPAWESLAETCERQGDVDRAEECRKTAKQIAEMIEWRRVEADIRRDHPFWKEN